MPDNPVVSEWAEHWRSYYDLSGDADCASPDRSHRSEEGGSPGALMLASVMEATIDAVEYQEPVTVNDLDSFNDDGTLDQIADDAPDVYTHTRWREFVDLAAYNEDVTELGDDGSDLTRTAGVALYMIAERLCAAMIADLRERYEEAEMAVDA